MSAPKLPSFFKSRQAKQFELKPRYYDPEKEERDQRRVSIKREVEQENAATDPEVFRSRLRERWDRSSRNQKGYSISVIRIAVILVLLAFIFFYVL